MAARTTWFALSGTMASQTTPFAIELVHSLLRPNKVAFLFACDGMTTATGIQIRVMTHSAGVVVFLMRFMIEGHCVHQDGRWGSFFVGVNLNCLDEDDIGLIALHPGNVLDLFYQLKLLRSVATAAFNWPSLLVFGLWRRLLFGQGLSVALDTGKMRCQPLGNPILFCLLLMAVNTRTFFSFGVE
jgi:hypothetical protein